MEDCYSVLLLYISIHMGIFFIWKSLIVVYSVEISPSENFLQGGKPLSLSVQSAGHTLHVFINGQLQGIYWEKTPVSEH